MREQKPPETGSVDQRRILVIEDDVTTLDLITRVLTQGGYTVHGLADGRRAIEWLESNAVDLVVSDIFMPEGDGIEVIRFVRSHSRATPLLVISGGNSLIGQDYLKVASQLGADRVLAKPFRPVDILSVVEEMLTAREALSPAQ